MEKLKNLETILVISTGFLVLHLIFGARWLMLAAVTVSVLGLMFPIVAKGINWAWWKLAFALGWVNSRILLSLVFFIFLMPVAFLQKLVSSDKLQLKRKTGEKDSYYIDRSYSYSKKDLENVW